MKIIQNAVAVAAIVGALSASAQTTNIILQTDFDGDAGQGNYSGSYGYCVAGTSVGNAHPAFIQSVTAGVGVNGSSANEILPDYTELANDPNWTSASVQWAYAVAGNGTTFAGQINPITPTTQLNSLIVSADLQVSGLLPGLTGIDVSITKVQFFDDNNDIIFDFAGDAGYVGSNFIHISVPLSSLTYGGGNNDAVNPVTDFTNAAVLGSITSFTIEFAVNGLAGQVGGTGANQLSPPFGFTNTGELSIDNLELIQVSNSNSAPPTPMVEKSIWQADYDNTFPNSGSFGFSFRDGSPQAVGVSSLNPTNGIGGSTSSEYTVDFSSWVSSPPLSYSGFGIGSAEQPLPYPLTSSSPASYRVYLSAKINGIGANSASGQVDLSFFTPSAQIYDLTSPMVFSTNWQSYVFDGGTNMQVATYLTGAQQMFNQNVTNVNKVEVQLTVQGSPDVGALFGYATNATIDIDNLKVVELVPGLAPLTVVQAGGQVMVTWTDPDQTTSGGTAKLQSAVDVAGPYIDVGGASSASASPYIVPKGSHQQFFRTVWIP